MAEKFSVYVMDGASQPMVSIKFAKDKTASIQIGKVFVAAGKTVEQVKSEIVEKIFEHSPTLQNWFNGKVSFKKKLAIKYGIDAGLEIYKLVGRIESQGRMIANLKTQLGKMDAGSICEQCGTYHQQGTKNLIIEPESHRVFCNYGCRDQYHKSQQMLATYQATKEETEEAAQG